MSDGRFTITPPTNSTGNATSGHSVQSETMSEESQMTAFNYILMTWGVFILSIITLVVIVCMTNRRRRHQEQQHIDNTMEEGRGVTFESEKDKKTPWNTRVTVLALIAVNATLALALSIYSILTCEFLQADDGPIYMTFPSLSDNDEAYTIEVYSLGLWSLVASSGAPGYLTGDHNGKFEACFELSDLFYLDSSYKMARASAVISSMIGGLTLLIFFLVLASDPVRPRIFNRLVAWSFGVTTVFQLLTLTFLATDYCDSAHCQLHFGGVASITAAAYWLFCVFAVLIVRLEQ
eukprot:CAMPEP_0113620798 /NCGR_PEP_ID=MMETSP0017_2-20120614/10608_1 /TAXON_ID=2856 /ORGANISM="Cylindrotheca closterium" /LENGTH=291 /DNA_ID=CAMNT_0000530489 /DNA_START=104 /DNA_END=979 /DNA_ORIENTATION=- /assembly_acc=CAM_ASM_000147